MTPAEEFLQAAESLYCRAAGFVRSVAVTLTTACNLRCSYCYQSRERSRTVSWDVVRAALDLVISSPHPGRRASFTGGEPLLAFPLLRRAVNYVCNHSAASSRPTLIVGTNGILLDRHVASFLASHHIRTQLSMDGVAAAQDDRGAGSFDQLDTLLRDLGREFPAYFRDCLSVHSTLTSRNVGYLAASIRYFLHRGVTRLVVTPLITHDGGWRTEMSRILDQQFDEIRKLSLSHWRRTRETPLTLFRRVQRPQTARPRLTVMCGLSEGDGVFVDVDGDVFACPAFGGDPAAPAGELLREAREATCVGNIREAGLVQRLSVSRAAMREVSMLNQREAKYSSYGRCAECEERASCQVCPASIGHIPGSTDPHRVPDLQCAFNLAAGKHSRRLLEEVERAPVAPLNRSRPLQRAPGWHESRLPKRRFPSRTVT